jgi:hypothetical protein
VLPEKQGRRPGRRHDGAATVVAARPPSRSCTGEEAASCSRPSGQAQQGGDVRVAAAVQPTRPRGGHRKHQSEGRSSSKARRIRSSRVGKIYWGRARRRWRRLEAEVTKPHDQEEARDAMKQRRHRAAADLAGVGRGARRRLSRQRGIRVRVRPRGERVRGNGRLGRAGSVKPTRGD